MSLTSYRAAPPRAIRANRLRFVRPRADCFAVRLDEASRLAACVNHVNRRAVYRV